MEGSDVMTTLIVLPCLDNLARIFFASKAPSLHILEN